MAELRLVSGILRTAGIEDCLRNVGLFTLAQSSVGLQADAQNDEGNTDVEGEVEQTGFAEKQESHEDGVARLEVVGEVDGEGRQTFEHLYLQYVEASRAEKGMAEHPPQVGTVGKHHDRRVGRETPEVDGNDEAHAQQAASHLIHEHGAAAHAH